MKYEVQYSNEFKRGLKKLKNDKNSLNLVRNIIKKLANDEILETKYKDHKLIGKYAGYRECHIKPDLLLIYKKDVNRTYSPQKANKTLILMCIALGSHSDLF